MPRALLATVVVLAMAGPACGGDGGTDCTSENATELSGTLTIKGFSFSPSCFSVASGSTISVANDDAEAHNFTVRGAEVTVGLRGGSAGEATAPAPGTYDFLCTIHPSMKGTIIVT
jgi:plastocyanin